MSCKYKNKTISDGKTNEMLDIVPIKSDHFLLGFHKDDPNSSGGRSGQNATGGTKMILQGREKKKLR